jgi:tripartite-type tricarboxylate transporter receptor subunit TctC
VENKGGGDGVIAISALAKSSPDGYTIGTCMPSPFVFLPHMREISYKTKENFEFIFQIAEYIHAFVVHRDAPWRSFKDFIEDARKKPNEFRYATVGVGERIFMRRITSQEKVKIIDLPLRSSAEQITNVLGKHADGGLIATIAPHIMDGSVRALAVDMKRWEIIPEVPTFQELGYKFDRPRWLGIGAPKGVPEKILKRLEDAFTQACNSTAYKDMVKHLYMRPVFGSGADLRKRILEDFDEQGNLLKTLDVGLPSLK